MPSNDYTYLGDGYSVRGSISSTSDREQDVSEIFKQSLRSEFVNTLPLDSSTSEYLRSFLLSDEATGVSSSETLGLETSVFNDNRIVPTSSFYVRRTFPHTFWSRQLFLGEFKYLLKSSAVTSLILPSPSEDKNKVYESVILTTKDSFSAVVPSSDFLSLIQKTESEGLIFKRDGDSMLSTDIKSSFP
ncbi:hypothetical protein TNIN_300041 [Trichonephila inaurata madagascariensis]|uniref:Uncharacterized protein n=1 Tax=Trichonephila inaurata madagascariensis TaxID=2747483 RepID=A0A8X6XAY2_9ARAC|nr:hypothetical protein TNIN_300041 [Trichonephila inaurata madagascariensis]